MYAIVKTGGKQYRVEKGQTLLVERLPADEGATVAARADARAAPTRSSFGDALGKAKVSAKVARPRARPQAARLQVQAQARLQEAGRPPPGAHPHRDHRDQGRRRAAEGGA